MITQHKQFKKNQKNYQIIHGYPLLLPPPPRHVMIKDPLIGQINEICTQYNDCSVLFFLWVKN